MNDCTFCGNNMPSDNAPCPHCGNWPSYWSRQYNNKLPQAWGPFTVDRHQRATPVGQRRVEAVDPPRRAFFTISGEH